MLGKACGLFLPFIRKHIFHDELPVTFGKMTQPREVFYSNRSEQHCLADDKRNTKFGKKGHIRNLQVCVLSTLQRHEYLCLADTPDGTYRTTYIYSSPHRLPDTLLVAPEYAPCGN